MSSTLSGEANKASSKARKSVEEASPAAPKAKSAADSTVVSRPRDAVGASPSSALAKAKAAAIKTSFSIAAQAARNLGGFVPNKIFVGGVPITATEAQFRQCFEVYGAINKIELHALRGFGYITYETVEAVDICLEKYEDHYLCKKWVEVKRSIPRDLIDAYEREQRRLNSLHEESLAAAAGDQKPAVSKAGASPSAASPSSAPTRSWGPGVAKGGLPAVGTSPGGSSAPTASAWSKPLQTVVAAPAPRPKAPSGATPQAAPVVPTTASAGASAPSLGAVPAGSLGRIAQLKEMGFSDEVSRRVLAECAWDVNKAIDRLLLSGNFGGLERETDGPEERLSAALEGVGLGADEPDGEASKSSTPAVGHSSDQLEGTGRTWVRKVAGDTQSPKNSPSSQSHTAAARPQVSSTEVSSAQPTIEAVIVEQPTVTEPAAATTQPDNISAEAPVVPKRFERASQSWSTDEASQLAVTEGQFVNVWTHTQTENGWIHAELASNENVVGWLPVVVLTKLPEGQRWMRSKQSWEARDASQCSVSSGEFVNVWLTSLTKEGWAYVESEKEECKGWLPAFCLEWNDN